MEHKKLNIARLHRTHLIWLMDVDYMLKDIEYLKKIILLEKKALTKQVQLLVLNNYLMRVEALKEKLKARSHDIRTKEERFKKAERISLFNFDEFLVEDHCDCQKQLNQIKQNIEKVKHRLYQYISEQKIQVDGV